MKTKRSNLAVWGSFQPREIEQVDAFGDFHFHDLELSEYSIEKLEKMAEETWSYLDRNAARVELAERRLAAWQERQGF
jgi:hypothetical protein